MEVNAMNTWMSVDYIAGDRKDIGNYIHGIAHLYDNQQYPNNCYTRMDIN